VCSIPPGCPYVISPQFVFQSYQLLSFLISFLFAMAGADTSHLRFRGAPYMPSWKSKPPVRPWWEVKNRSQLIYFRCCRGAHGRCSSRSEGKSTIAGLGETLREMLCTCKRKTCRPPWCLCSQAQRNSAERESFCSIWNCRYSFLDKYHCYSLSVPVQWIAIYYYLVDLLSPFLHEFIYIVKLWNLGKILHMKEINSHTCKLAR
jgi:hypothetical protein